MFYVLLPSFILLDVAWWIIAHRRLRAADASRVWRWLVGCFAVPMIVYLLMSLLFAGPIRRSGGLPPVVHAFIYLWHFFALPLLAAMFGITRLGRKARAYFSRAKKVSAASVERASTPVGYSLSRRQILTAAAIATPPLVTAGLSTWSMQNLYARRLRSFDLKIPKLPRQLDGMTIAHVTDTHIGKFLNPDRLPAIAEDINKLDADFVAFTGDLIDLALEDLPYGIDFLRSLKSRCGLVVCEGNHDIMQNRGDFEHAMENAGLPIILGSQRTMAFTSRDGRSFPVQFLAVPWNNYDAEMSDAVNVLRPEISREAFPILLAHHPHSFDAAASAGIPLILSGHTHGGQIMLNSQVGLGSIRFRYTSGLYQKPGSTLIVNNGIGNWFPVRINAPAELVHITLRSAV